MLHVIGLRDAGRKAKLARKNRELRPKTGIIRARWHPLTEPEKLKSPRWLRFDPYSDALLDHFLIAEHPDTINKRT
jgi:hypothetical protein